MANVGIKNRNLYEPVLQCIDVPIRKGHHLKVTGFWGAAAKTLCFDLNEVEIEEWKGYRYPIEVQKQIHNTPD